MGPKPKSGGGGIALGQVEQILTQLAPNDASHDFGTDRPTDPRQKEAYNKGLYKGSGNTIDYGTEADSLTKVVSDPPNYIPMTSANPYKDYCRTSEHTITVLGDEKKIYTVKYADVKYKKNAKDSYIKMLDAKEDKAKAKVAFDAIVKGLNDDKNTKMAAAAAAAEPALVATPAESFIGNLKKKITKTLAEITAIKSSKSGGSSKSEPKDEREEIDAPMFYDMMGLDPNQNIALVIDAASIGIIDILSTGTFKGKRPIVYYIYGPEVVHDPAKKKHPSSPEFNRPTGVQWIPCVSMNPRDFVYCYDYNPDPTGLYLNKFFTSFEFGLSELQETVNGKTIDYTTDLTIKAFDGPEKTKVKFIDESIDSKSKSDISFLTEMINMLRDAMASGDEKEFQYAIAYLKKMAGDWLQVLLALAIAMRSRGFTPYRGPVPSAPAGKAAGGGKEIRPNITATIDRVFFLTHDQIALAFALCNGVECIFTHHTVVKGEGNPSLYSAFLYSLMSPEKVKESIINKASTLTPKNYAAEIATLTSNVKEYVDKRFASIRGPVDALNHDITEYLKHPIANPFQVDWFDRYVRTLFTASLKIVAIKKILPDLNTIELGELTEKNEELKTALETFNSDKNVETAKQLLELDAYVDSQIKSCQKTIESAQYFFSQKDAGSPMVINEQIREFTKELIYVAAANWSWDSPDVSTRKLVNLTSMRETQAFNADRNIFINHLNSLDDDIKSQITLIFARCYDFIQKNNDPTKFQNTIKKGKGKDKTETTAILTPPQIQKFKPMATTFCYEVFLNLGGKYNIPSDTTGKIITKEEIDGYCNTIITVNALNLLRENNISESAKTTIKPEDLTANHTSETVLVQQMNESDNGGIDRFEKEHVFNPEEITILTSSKETLPPPPPTVKPSKNSMRFSSVFSACQLLKERILSQTLGRGERNIGLFGGAKNRAMHMKGGAAPMCNFHHQLPLYILLFQLHKTLSNENFEESLDYELTLEYYGFLLKIQEEFAELKEKENNEDAVKIGLGIRDLFFINNVVSDDIKVKSLPPMPSKFLSFSGLLTTGFCGALNEEYFKNVEDREASIKDPVFVDFITNMQIPERFSGQLDSDGVVYKDFIKAVSQSANEVAQQIITDREGERQQMISESDSNVAEVDVKEDDEGNEETGKGNSDADKDIYKFKDGSKGNYVPLKESAKVDDDNFSIVPKGTEKVVDPTSVTLLGGRKTRRNRRKRTRRPKKHNNKKTRKRRR